MTENTKRHALFTLKKDDPSDLREKKLVAVASAFTDHYSSDEEADEKKKLTAAEIFTRKYANNKANKALKKTMAEDPTIFEYDEVYDTLKRTRGETIEQKEVDKERKPKYVDNLLKAHNKRKLQRLIHDEHVYQKEREKEAGQFDDSEAFITESYRKKIAEREKFRIEMERDDALDEMTSAKNQKMWQQAFHRKLLDDITHEPNGKEGPKPSIFFSQHSSLSEDISLKEKAEETIEKKYPRNNTEKKHMRTEDLAVSGYDEECDDSKKNRRPAKHNDKERKPYRLRRAQSPSASEMRARMATIRNIVARRNNTEAVEAARQRFIERQATILAPI